jgi:hypothetical protein
MMIANTGGRARFGRLAGALAAGVLAVGAVSLSATAGSAAVASTTHGTTSTAELTAQARNQVPWPKVGQGWVLAEYDSGAAGKTAPVTLYLISPAGVRYSMRTWSGRGMIPYLIAWSGDKTRALLGLLGSQYEQLTLSTGKLSVGKKPVPLTPQRGSKGPDLGDIGAWQLSSGLYVQGLTGCGTMAIFKQAANGSIKVVNVPGASGNNNQIVTALGSRLLVHAHTGCPGSASLLWFNPATHAEQWLLRTPTKDAGVIGVVAYNSTENAQPF